MDVRHDGETIRIRAKNEPIHNRVLVVWREVGAKTFDSFGPACGGIAPRSFVQTSS
jgi:hypothetical protein